VAAGRFREDLFFRLSVIPLRVPPLRERLDDVPALAAHFLALYAAENDVPAKRLSPDAVRALQALPWRGNVRELRNAIERLAILGEGPVIDAGEVRALAGLATLAMPAAHAPAAGGGAGASLALEDVRAAGGLIAARREFERRAIELALDATGGNVSQTAQVLGIERSNLHKKMQSLGLEARPSRPSRNATEEDPE
jgi:DNA-binding NtrC family response regulator